MEHSWAFYSQQKDRLFAYLMHLCGDYDQARDIMQESFTRYLQRYGPTQDIPALLYAIARNALYDANRRQQHRRRESALEIEDQRVDPEHNLAVRDECRRVVNAMQQLAQSDRDLLALVVTRQLSYRQIAQIIGCSEASVKVRVHRTRLKLRRILEANER